MIKIVLISTGQPSTNPRIVKEAEALLASGYDVTIIYSFLINWAAEEDKTLLQNVGWKYKMSGGKPGEKKLTYLLTRIRFKAAKFLNKYLGQLFSIAERAQVRAYDELLCEAKNIKADWYIGHNLGALAIAVKAAKYNNANAGFDFEDYHRGELLAADINSLRRIRWLENKYLPFLQYYSTASEMITAAVKKDHPGFKGDIITLLNCFPLHQQPGFINKLETDKTLQLFWFSQTIGKNRGLEILIEALIYLKDPSIHLTLAGRCDNMMKDYMKSNAAELLNNIHFAGIIQPEKLPAFASRFDVGMAIELKEPLNRDICLTNKIFIYLLAGNAIILSETQMQSAFNSTYRVGESFKTTHALALAKKIMRYKDRTVLHNQQLANYELAKNILNWEKESEKFISLIKSFHLSGH